MAKAINKAYEKGILMVAAAGNCIVQGIANIGPKKLVFPAVTVLGVGAVVVPSLLIAVLYHINVLPASAVAVNTTAVSPSQ